MFYKDRDFTNGSILKAIIFLAIPLILTNALQTIYQITDTFWVGQLGTSAVAATTISFPITFILLSIGMGISIAGSVLIAQYKGKKDQKNIDFIATQTLIISTITGITLSIIGILLSPILVNMLTQDPEIIHNTILYLNIFLSASTFIYIYNFFASSMRGIGKVYLPLIIVFFTIFLNFFLDPLFIFGFYFIPALGVSGAAMATFCTQFLSAFIGLIILFRGKSGIHIKKTCLKPEIKTIKKLIKLGSPSSAEFLIRSISFLMINFLVAGFGTIALATAGLGGNIISFAMMPTIGISMAVSTLVGQNIGAKKFDRVNKTILFGSIFTFSLMLFFGIIFFVFAKELISVFVPLELDLIKETTLFLRIVTSCFVFFGMAMTFTGAIRGAGRTKEAMLLSISMLIGQLTSAIILVNFFGLIGVWGAYPIGIIFTFIISFIYVKKHDWSKDSLVHK